jgi:YfiH family protein
MPFHQPDAIRYFTFESLDELKIRNAIFTRKGGVSPNPWASLNVGGLVGDDPTRVMKNKELALQAMGLSLENTFDVWQIHGDQVVCTETPRRKNEDIRKGDAILTDKSGIVLFMRFADCVPILLYDPFRRVAGMIHMGWKGIINGIIPATINVMRNKYRTNPSDIVAAIGPSICVNHYEVGDEIVDQIKGIFPRYIQEVISSNFEKPHLDLMKSAFFLLEKSGVTKIENSNLCTACDLENWYSHRAEGGITGRFAALITIS